GFSEELSGRENIRRRLMLQGLTRRKIKRLLPEIIEFSELEDVIDEPVRTYSAGMGAKLAFSVVTAAVNDVVLLDEILAVGDEHFHAKSSRRIRDICSSGRTVVVASHDIAFVDRLCHQAVWLEEGRVRQQGDAHVVSMAYSGKDSEKVQAGYPREFGQIESVRINIVGTRMRVISHIRVCKSTPNLQYQVTVFDNRLGIISTMTETAWSDVPVPGEIGVIRISAEFETAAGLSRGLVGTALRHASNGASPVVQDAWGWDNAKQVYFKNPGWTDGRGYIRKPFEWTRCS
ncbi:MAG: hypothetical protein KAV00_02185, partial [Phycisphaerae bacterium]|nr:hypothetical protein [Phycisphaerae bacterium]